MTYFYVRAGGSQVLRHFDDGVGASIPPPAAIDRLSSIKWGVGYRLMILGVVTYVLIVARTGTHTVPTALGVPFGYAQAVTRVLGPTIAMSVTILKL